MPISDLLAQISGDAQSSVVTSTPPLKRKAETELPRAGGKPFRRDDVSAGSARPVPQLKNRSDFLPAQSLSARTKNSSIVRPQALASKGPSESTTSSSVPSKPPKKGSFAEILARGKAAQQGLGQVGKIQHKPIEKATSRRERQGGKDLKSQGNRTPNTGVRQAGQAPSRNGRTDVRPSNGKPPKAATDKELPRKIKKAATATTGYTGTARPNLTSTKSSAKPEFRSGYGARPDRDRPSPGSSRRYTYASEEEDEGEEGEELYDSEASSDMEAATFEVDEEEERAGRIARQEDADALREENRLKREKEEKRKKLTAMAKSRR